MVVTDLPLFALIFQLLVEFTLHACSCYLLPLLVYMFHYLFTCSHYLFTLVPITLIALIVADVIHTLRGTHCLGLHI